MLAELNVTPLLDLAFVLLIIFMMTAPLMRQGIELNLPTTKARQDPALGENVVNLAVSQDGTLTVNGAIVIESSLAEILRRLVSAKPDLAVVLETPQTLPVQRLVELLEQVKAAGAARMGIITRTPN
jgi:biopolymer transport protein ExbD